MPTPARKRLALALPPLLMAMAGCGVGQWNGANGGAFSIMASSSTTSTSGQVQFTAILANGETAPVAWSIAEGENPSSLGEGRIDAAGLYTPPTALARDTVQVRVLATLKSDPTAQASELITISPGFVQSLLPENAALTPGRDIEITAEIAEVGNGSVHWSLSGNAPAADRGTLSTQNCSHSLDQYTTCKITYTAPGSIPAAETITLTASTNGVHIATPLRILVNNNGWNTTPSVNQSMQTGPISLGSSGGNDNDYDTYQDKSGNPYIANCCGGTLGALVQDTSGSQYILSNNHVLAESDQAQNGDIIDAPGLIDNGCVPLDRASGNIRPVGTLRYSVPLSSNRTNVDAALAAVTPGAVDSSGSILQLEPTAPGNTTSIGSAPPVAGTGETLDTTNLADIHLVKSGRTTGLTCSTVQSVDLSVRIDYYKDCAETQPYTTKTFSGQIGITGDHFSDSGDSGALIVDSANAQPVGLLFSSGTDGSGTGLSVASPIGEVLNELGSQAGSSFSVVGTNTPHAVACVQYDAHPTDPWTRLVVSPDTQSQAKTIAETAGQGLIGQVAGVLGVASGKSLDSPGDAALVVYTDASRGAVAVPKSYAGLRTQPVATTAAALAREQAPTHPAAVAGLHLTADALSNAESVVSRYASSLLSDPAIFGVGVTQSADNPAEPAILVLVDMSQLPASTPLTLGGLRVRYMRLHPFHLTQSKYETGHPHSACALRGLQATQSGRSIRSIQDALPLH
ncbi:hypothetical protein [Silvibacterium dinghuense]|uniref:Serine protease n=1 Tax=Silvibacterium dinghuense TaxID=1560006 RepID=A0A4Q1SBV7_9BACT|nr:hypothetical protein [Silvibacterium dinghuense]RXS94509.1 hypothetical protein ESZ00_15695 [Silvibacterium dinghuense]GGH15663.1 hypothetical protein GCM10011586_36910 [Silvibacterium dinghuense]